MGVRRWTGTSNVLVAYASKHGSTREVAEVISSALQERGDRVEVRPAGNVCGSLGHPDLVVLGGSRRRRSGRSGIRTHGPLAGPTVFKTVAFVRSAILPREG